MQQYDWAAVELYAFRTKNLGTWELMSLHLNRANVSKVTYHKYTQSAYVCGTSGHFALKLSEKKAWKQGNKNKKQAGNQKKQGNNEVKILRK